MATLKRTDWIKWDTQAKANGGYSFDAHHYIIWNEKRITKKLPTEREGDFIELVLDWESERSKNGRFWASTGKVIPVLTVNKLRRTGTSDPSSSVQLYHSSELHHETVGESADRKNYAALCKIAASVNVPELMKRVQAKLNETN